MSQALDGDSSPTPAASLGADVRSRVDNSSKQFSQEFRLDGATDTYDWVAGLYYYQDEKGFKALSRNLLPAASAFTQGSDAIVKTRAVAVFGQIGLHITDKVRLEMGVRYNDEKRELTRGIFTFDGLGLSATQNVRGALASPSNKSRDFTGKLGIQYQPNEDTSLYATYSRGLKSPGFSTFWGFAGGNPNDPTSNAIQTGPVGQEKLDAFEVGGKLRLLDNRLSINAAAFYYVFDGKQENPSVVNPVTGSVSALYLNIGQAEIKGAELELSYSPTPRWDIKFGGGLTDAKVTKSSLFVLDDTRNPVSIQGKRLRQVPKWNMNAILAYHIPMGGSGRLTLQGEVSAKDRENFSLYESPLGWDTSRVLANFRILWNSEDGRYNAQAFVTNAFNKNYLYTNGVQALSARGHLAAVTGAPRLWGVKLGAKF